MNTPKQQGSGAFVSLAAGVGSALGAAVGAITGDWFWMPVVLSVCIALAAVGAALSGGRERTER